MRRSPPHGPRIRAGTRGRGGARRARNATRSSRPNGRSSSGKRRCGHGRSANGLTAALEGRRCLIYNRWYDVPRLHWELTRHHQAQGHADPTTAAAAWIDAYTFEDVMVPYSDWYGDWSDYWGNYSWQPLDGGHRALGDVRAVVERLREMAGLVPAASTP
jgi:hypothetical protein